MYRRLNETNRNFQLVLDEMEPCRTSRAWYFHSPALIRQSYCFQGLEFNDLHFNIKLFIYIDNGEMSIRKLA